MKVKLTNENLKRKMKYKIAHLDAGRKYFSPANIKEMIRTMAEAKYNQFELYFSDNQGFRLALDDMKISTAIGKNYDLSLALGDGYIDGDKFPDGSKKYLTQSEVDEVIAYAREREIELVSCINTPGHMGAILEVFPQFRYKGSKSSIDLENEEAVSFALAILEKYAAYFESRGVKYFNIGADEYANDMSTMGFEGLYQNGNYGKFVDYLNRAAQIVIEHHMIPRVFNDGIYYANDTSFKFNSEIQVCYWSSGWTGYQVALPTTIQEKGHELINANGDYYWVLGRDDWKCSKEMAERFSYEVFQGEIHCHSSGGMFCIWCDNGKADGRDEGENVIRETRAALLAFGEKR